MGGGGTGGIGVVWDGVGYVREQLLGGGQPPPKYYYYLRGVNPPKPQNPKNHCVLGGVNPPPAQNLGSVLLGGVNPPKGTTGEYYWGGSTG